MPSDKDPKPAKPDPIMALTDRVLASSQKISITAGLTPKDAVDAAIALAAIVEGKK